MKQVNRREFIKKSLFTSGTLFLSLTPFGKIFPSISTHSIEEKPLNVSATEISLQKNAKEYFFAKNYQQAENTYLQLINQFPNYIPGYDGLAKTYYAQNKALDVVNVYRSAFVAYPNDILITDRYARSIVRLVLGNRKLTEELCNILNEKKPLNYACNLYIDKLKETNNKGKAFLYFGLLDVKKSLAAYNQSQSLLGYPEINFTKSIDNKIENLTSKFSQKWAFTRKKKRKKDYQAKSLLEAKGRHNKSINRLQRTLNFESEKESRRREENKFLKGLYYPAFFEAIKNNSVQEAEDIHKKISLFDPDDNYSTGKMIKLYRNKKMYNQLVSFQKEKYERKDTFWNALSYAQSLRLQSRKEQKKHLSQKALKVYQSIDLASSLSSKEYLSYYSGLVDCYYQLENYTAVKNTIIQVFEERFPYSFTPLVVVYLRSLAKEGNVELAEKGYFLLTKGIDDSTLHNNPIYNYLRKTRTIIERNNGYEKEAQRFGLNKENFLDIYYGMFELYELKNDSTYKKEVLTLIQKIDPQNEFAQKRL